MRISVKRFFYGLLFTLLIFNNIFSQWISLFRYLDEIIGIISLVYICLYAGSIFKKKYNIVIFACFTMAAAIGLAGNLAYGFQPVPGAILKDLLAYYKMPLTFAAVYHWSENKDLYSAHKAGVTLSKIFTVIIFAGCFLSLFREIGLSYGVRYGFRTYKFLFSHPTFLVYALVLCSVVLVSDQENNLSVTKNHWGYHLQILFCLLFTFRDKAFGYIMLFAVLLFVFRKSRKIKMRYFILAGLGALYLSYNKLVEYSQWSWSPREALYVNGLQLMCKVFPLGSGFGTFNSSLSGKFYSKAYYLFGLQNKPGMNAMDYIDLGDAQLPYYYAQFGVFGFALVVMAAVMMFKCVKIRFKGKSMEQKAAYLLLGYMAIGMLVEAVFTNESGVTFILVLFLYLSSHKRQNITAEKYCEGMNGD